MSVMDSIDPVRFLVYMSVLYKLKSAAQTLSEIDPMAASLSVAHFSAVSWDSRSLAERNLLSGVQNPSIVQYWLV